MLKLVEVRNLNFKSDLECLVRLSAENIFLNNSMFSEYEVLSDDYKKDIFLAFDNLAYSGIRPVGFSSGEIVVDRFGDKNFNLKSLYVTPEYRGIGIGKELIHKVNHRALTLGCQSIKTDLVSGFLLSNGFNLNKDSFKKSVYSNLLEIK